MSATLRAGIAVALCDLKAAQRERSSQKLLQIKNRSHFGLLAKDERYVAKRTLILKRALRANARQLAA